MAFNLTVNGKPVTVDVPADMPLLWVIREVLNMPGTKFGCGMSLCGACTVHINGKAERSCVTSIAEANGKQITTIEGLAGATLHPLQKAWMDVDVAQCGYCQAGQLMSAAALLKEHPNPTDAQIDEAMDGNICRCGTYLRIREAIHKAAAVGKGRSS
jgi:aerobic-type carbon monoxide dehydrogenase small subunit (CoxS/CutS family)